MPLQPKRESTFAASKTNDKAAIIREAPKLPKTALVNYDSNDIEKGQGFMSKVRRVQENFADSFCSCADNLPTPVFLAVAIIILILVALLIGALIVWAASGPQFLRKGEELSQDDEEELDNNDFNVTYSNNTSLFKLFTNEMPISQGLSFCRRHGFPCKSQPSMVINVLQRCDGISQCPDGSDEEKCQDCNTAFKCERKNSDDNKKKYFLCLRAGKLCDGTDDCDDRSDETICGKLCGKGEYNCYTTDKCIPNTFKCDGEKHCLHGDDEAQCDGKCNNGALWCPNSETCIPKWKLCDGVWDCSLGEDEKNCTCRECCGSKNVLCKRSNVCIPRKSICNGYHDCPDGSDEENCPGICRKSILKKFNTVRCLDGHLYDKQLACSGILKNCDGMCDKCIDLYAFTCKDGGAVKCVSKLEVCDGKKDCADGSDEADCGVKLDHRCARSAFGSNAKWLKKEQLCDGIYDCVDHDDEQNCNHCGNNGIYCSSTHACLSKFQRCDGVVDCADGSDEVGCSCEDCSYRNPPMFKCSNSDQCVPPDRVCDLCKNQTAREKAFCAYRDISQ